MKKSFQITLSAALALAAVSCSDTGNGGFIPGTDPVIPQFEIIASGHVQQIAQGTTQVFDLNTSAVNYYQISQPLGWHAEIIRGKLHVTSPAAINSNVEQTGELSVKCYSVSNDSVTASITVSIHALKVLTFEDADARFDAYPLEYCNKTIARWSDLIDNPQYAGPLLYGSGAGMDSPLYWYDAGNTELFHVFPEAFGTYCYWSGGHAVSNYASTDIAANGGFEQQLTVPGTPGAGGHNGSANFAMHNGYIDNGPYAMLENLPTLEFYDGQARVIDHMWVNNGTYAVNAYVNGTSFAPKAGPSEWVKIIATGTHADGSTARTEFFLLNGPDNIVDKWTFWNLSTLGAVTKVEFNLTGSSDNGYGFSQPSYFAYDDVAVRF